MSLYTNVYKHRIFQFLPPEKDNVPVPVYMVNENEYSSNICKLQLMCPDMSFTVKICKTGVPGFFLFFFKFQLVADLFNSVNTALLFHTFNHLCDIVGVSIFAPPKTC